VAKVRAAIASRTDPALVIIARSDALAVNGWDDTLARARAYREAGADMVFLDGLKTRADVERAAAELAGIPQLLNSLFVTPADAAALGFAIQIHLGVMMRHFADFRRSLAELRTTGNIALTPAEQSVQPITGLLLGDLR
jgi:2-methylisocitrate lyase-like PEP mutase family enzyme